MDKSSTSTIYRILASYNSLTAELNLSINGVDYTPVSGVGSLAKHTGAVCIGQVNGKAVYFDGNNSNNSPFGGKISELIIYNAGFSGSDQSALELYFDTMYPKQSPYSHVRLLR